jgi:hypothetical protein
MTVFTTHITYRVESDGTMQRTEGQLPSVIKLPAISVTVAPNASTQATARLLGRLADELEGATI